MNEYAASDGAEGGGVKVEGAIEVSPSGHTTLFRSARFDLVLMASSWASIAAEGVSFRALERKWRVCMRRLA